MQNFETIGPAKLFLQLFDNLCFLTDFYMASAELEGKFAPDFFS